MLRERDLKTPDSGFARRGVLTRSQAQHPEAFERYTYICHAPQSSFLPHSPPREPPASSREPCQERSCFRGGEFADARGDSQFGYIATHALTQSAADMNLPEFVASIPVPPSTK